MLALLWTACRQGEGPSQGDEERLSLGESPCDPLVTAHCLLPFPSDRYLQPDPSTVTGYRLVYPPEALPIGVGGAPFDPAAWARMDGASPAGQIIAAFEAAPDLSEAAFHDSIERSLDASSPTALIDLETGELLPHWVELDAQADISGPPMVFLRPIRRLEEDRSYGVAYRSLRSIDGSEISPSEAFRALRDGLLTDDPELERRRPAMEELLDALEAAGLARGELTLAWRFHTASGDAIRGDLMHIRADAIERLGEGGISCSIDEVIEDYGAETYLTSKRWIRGTIRVPSYVDSPTPPARFVRGADGSPTYVEDVDVEFSAIVPMSLAEDPRPERFVFYGHGLMGDHEDYTRYVVRDYAEWQQTVIAVTNWAGMSSDDLGVVSSILDDVSLFPAMAERLQQGMINQIALSRTLAGVCRDNPAFQVDGVSLIDPERVYFGGGSQGGIFGSTLMAIHPDVERGVLFVGGAGYPFMMDRSIDFVPFLPLFEASYPSRADRSLLLSVAQHLWDATDGASYLPYLRDGLPGVFPKEVLMVAAENDSQVPNLATDYAMRTAGLPIAPGASRLPWGFEIEEGPYDGSGYITIDLGDRPVPAGNEPPTVNDQGHSLIGGTDAAQRLVERFLQPDGLIDAGCDGECDPD